MASALRPTMLRQAFAMTAAKRAFPISTRASLLDSQMNGAARIAAFHTTQKRAILPALPQKIEGTINDAYRAPPATPSHGSYHWTFERLMSAGLVPLTIAPFAAGSLNPTLDALFCAGILIHSHIGFQSIIIDYVPTWRLPKTRRAFMWALNAATLLVGVGFYEFETNDVGLTEAIKRIWHA